MLYHTLPFVYLTIWMFSQSRKFHFCDAFIYIMCLQTFYVKGPNPLLWAGLWATRGKITVSGIPNHCNYCVIVIVYRIYKCGFGPLGWRPTV